MKNRVIFKAKDLKDQNWIEGSYIKSEMFGQEVHSIVNSLHQFIPIDINTLSLYTPFRDKKGILICENDIVAANYRIYKIIFDGISFKASLSPKYKALIALGHSFENGKVEILGNIFDNPELL